MSSSVNKYKEWALSPWRFRIAMLKRLPSLVFWGISIKALTDERCEVILPFSATTKNPFNSIYFSALSGAAELSTGALLQMHLTACWPHSMLVTNFQARFLKKATGSICFTCSQGGDIINSLQSLQSTGDTATLVLHAQGINKRGEVVMDADITWAIRRK